ncbi:MAG TPA: 3-deoxy-manno-octulosonate cytidylyltransferase [Gemmatimonadaceae bacterium]|nr:3-deoxy-manno-octulosonate cytidylyltransferase [Gemmatimonadaceae bacterium]
MRISGLRNPLPRVRTLAVIPARLGATRLPRKPLRLLAGVPIIVRVMERVRALRVADVVVVATDSDEVMRCIEEAGGEAIPTAASHPSGTDRVAEVVRTAGLGEFDAILNVQGDEPFVSGAAVRGALAQVTGHGFPVGTAACHAAPDVLDDPNAVKVVTADDGAAMYFSRAPIPYLRDRSDAPDREARALLHVGVYAYTPDALARWVALPPHPLERVERLEQLRPLAAGVRIGVATFDGPLRAGIDTEADLERANDEWMTFNPSES